MKPCGIDTCYHQNADGIYVPNEPTHHREEDYDEAGFDILRKMQSQHFWYQGRHRFVRWALRNQLRKVAGRVEGLRAIDLGGGCGGWIRYLQTHPPTEFSELALSDSSLRALALAGPVVGENVARYQIDLLNLRWQGRWEIAFLLDVLEHIPQDEEALRQIAAALSPGGLLFVTTPALRQFWSYNDELVHHVRRYSRRDFARLARAAGFELRAARYFMFFLSPLLWLARLRHPDFKKMTREEMQACLVRTHRVPTAPVNLLLWAVFACETPLGFWLPLPWGTSILGVFQKPC
jgi:2-polyprenyl-3-methyl-5-hydroxy-6-metoxy-1,4-benzoquinol methylase